MGAVQSQTQKTLTRFVLVGATCLIAFLVLGGGLYFWKEHAHHFKAGAKSHLLALHTMQENYRTDHGRYANNFAELGVPLGARLQGDALHWDGPYHMRFTRMFRDQNGAVVHYTIEAKTDSSGGGLPTIEIDETGILRP
jgi:hypothetical protein